MKNLSYHLLWMIPHKMTISKKQIIARTHNFDIRRVKGTVAMLSNLMKQYPVSEYYSASLASIERELVFQIKLTRDKKLETQKVLDSHPIM